MYDPGRRRLGQRGKRERGLRIYIPADDLAQLGFDDVPGPIYYRTWPGRNGGLSVRLYRKATG